MIFQPDAIELVRARRKTQTRRPVKVLTPERVLGDGTVVPAVLERECRYRPGKKYTCQPGRGKPGVLDITVFEVRQERLGDISQQDARREGFLFVAQFWERWEQLHGAWDPEMLVWVITFLAGDLRDRFDHPRLLAATPGRIGFEPERLPDNVRQVPGARWPGGRWHVDADLEEHQDYTDRPKLAMAGSADPGEGLTERQLKPFVEDAHRRDEIRRRTVRAELPRSTRIRELEQQAAAGDQQAQRHLFVIDQRIHAAERQRARGSEAA